MDSRILLAIAIIFILVVLYFIYKGNFKKIPIQCINLVTGSPKTGKSLLCSDLAPKQYKKVHRSWWFATHVMRKEIEEPLFYTNTIFSFRNIKNSDNFENCKRKPHRLDKNIRYLDIEVLRREKRLPYKSVVYIQEASLTSDQQEYLDRVLNCEQSLFNKLFGHETHGGTLFYDTQNVQDCHYAIKRCCGSYQWILKSKNFFFFRLLYVRELINSENISGAENNFNEDVDLSVRKYIVWRWVYKRYDRYYFDYLTNDLPISDKKFDYKNGVREISSFSELYRDAGKGMKEEEMRKRDNKRQTERALQLYKEKYYFRKENKND